jgi:hypothetical protein
MTEFLTLVFAIYLADCLFEVTRLFVTFLTRSRQRRDARGRFAPVRPAPARSPRT